MNNLDENIKQVIDIVSELKEQQSVFEKMFINDEHVINNYPKNRKPRPVRPVVENLICTSCKVDKLLSEYYVGKTSCKICHSIYNKSRYVKKVKSCP
tara:strand:+ start:17 stop:307 length:291 start_codon:yes stop_codon:yes gene_type:complete